MTEVIGSLFTPVTSLLDKQLHRLQPCLLYTSDAADDLEKRLAVSPLPLELWLASSGPPQAMERKLKPLQSQVVQAGYHCEQIANDLSHARLLRCRFQAMSRSE